MRPSIVMWRVVVVSTVLVVIDAARAHACTCAYPSVPERDIEVPVNMKDVMATVANEPSLVETVTQSSVPVGNPILVWGA